MTIKSRLCLALSAFVPPLLFAQAGSLDGDFDGDGRVTTAILSGDNKANCLAVQPNGYIVAAGSTISSGAGASTNYALVRYRPDGSLDNTFSLNGKADFGIATAAADDAEAIAILPNGKILVAGNSAVGNETGFSALLLNSNGTSFDVSFGTNGKLLLENEDFFFKDMVIQPDGKIVAVGNGSNGQNSDFKVIRLNADGSFDNTFSGDGRVLIPVATNAIDFAEEVALQADGKIVIAGKSVSSGVRSIGLARLNPNGSLDNTFSFDGKLTTLVDVTTDGNAVLIQSDGKIVVAGQSADNLGGISKDMVLVRYQTDGTLDPTFSTDGKVTITLVGDDLGLDVLQQSDGKLLLIGSSGAYNGVTVVRLLPNGTYDSSFGLAGFTIADFAVFVTPSEAAFTPNNRLVVAGSTSSGVDGPADFALAQFLLGLIVGVEDLGQSNTQLIYPNPIDNQAVFQYELPEAGEITLSLFDLQGRMLHVFLSERNPKRRVQKPKHWNFPRRHLRDQYFLQLKTEWRECDGQNSKTIKSVSKSASSVCHPCASIPSIPPTTPALPLPPPCPDQK
jgi:uncharacterized delta-60 repeat protein